MMRPTIVRGSYHPIRSASGQRSYLPIRGLIRYIAFGRFVERMGRMVKERGNWVDQAGNMHPQRAIERWAKDKVHRFGYDHTYQLLLSTGKGGLDSADFNASLQSGSNISNVREWRMMTHTDTDNQHAHAILFRHEPLSRKEYLRWQRTMQQTLDKRQMQRLLEQEQLLEKGVQNTQSAETPTSQQERSWGIEL